MSKLGIAASAIRRSWAIDAAAKRATAAHDAAKWFGDYGKSLVGKDACSVNFKLAFASACVGSKEVEKLMAEAIFAMLPEIVLEAERMATRDLDALIALVGEAPYA